MQKITPHLWYDKEAKEAAEFYVSVFGGDSKVLNVSTLHDTPSGDCDIVSFKLLGQPFMAISAGPYFKFNPSVSFIVNFDPSRDKDASKSIDAVWKKLSAGGKELMPLQEYPWSKRYGWVQDKYGLSWQIILTNSQGKERPAIVPSILFTGSVYGKAKRAMEYYLSVFEKAPFASAKGKSGKGEVMLYGKGTEPNKEGTVMFADFKLLGQWFAAMDGAGEHNFQFNEAISFIISCDSQEEIDYYWKLSAVPEAEQCGWLRDKFGLVWQVTASAMEKMIQDKDEEKVARVTQALLKMKKFDLKTLEEVYEGK